MRRNRINIACLVCGKDFEIIASRNGLAKFCSKKCYYVSKAGRTPWNKGLTTEDPRVLSYVKNGASAKKGSIPWNKGKTIKTDARIVQPWLGKKRDEATIRKMSLGLRKRIGVLSSNWKGGKTRLNYVIRGNIKYREWRESVFNRDNFKCLMCGVKCGQGKKVILNADHFPTPFYKIIDNNKIISLEQALCCEPLWDVNNGRTLCYECHLKTRFFHSNQYKKVNH